MRVTILQLREIKDIETLVTSRENTLSVGADQQADHRKFGLLAVEDLIRCGPASGLVFGAWDSEDNLVGMLTTAVSYAQPCYFMRKAYTSPGAPLQTLSALFTRAIDEYENRGYNRFYTMYRTKDIGLYHRLWRTMKTLQNYVTYTDIVMPPNTRPKHTDYWELLCGRSLYVDEMSVRAFIRKSDSMYFNEVLT